MAVVREDPGRPRRYNLETGVEGIADPNLGYAAALLTEAADRLIDVITGVSNEALLYKPTPETPCIARFVIHMAWAETAWLTRISPVDASKALSDALAPGNLSILQGKTMTPLPPEVSAAYLVDLILQVRRDVTAPAVRTITDLDSQVLDGPGPRTPRQALAHLVWHWTYHSGQVGLLRLQSGSDYTWSFA
jgi:uncharacterized damage-inducible protein DinB